MSLLGTLLLTACSTAPSKALDGPVPDVKVYSREVLTAGAAEIRGGQCPVLSNVFMPGFKVMRDQSRALSESR